MHERTRFGRWGERAAAAYLRHQGYIIEAQNYSSSHGELDLVARKGHLLVFVEVKTAELTFMADPAMPLRRKKPLASGKPPMSICRTINAPATGSAMTSLKS